MGDSILYRDHRGWLDESLKTTKSVRTIEEIKDHISKTLDIFGKWIESVKFNHVGYDERTGWDTYNVIGKYKWEDWEFVAWMTNGIPQNNTLQEEIQVFSEFWVKAYDVPEKLTSNFEKSRHLEARKETWEKQIKVFLQMAGVDAEKQIKIYKMAEKLLDETYITVYDPAKLTLENHMFGFSVKWWLKEEDQISLWAFLEIALKLVK